MYYVRVQGTIYGPYSMDQLRTLVERGQVTSAHEVSTDKEQWMSASALKELFPKGSTRPEPIVVAQVDRGDVDAPATPARRRRQRICDECGEEIPANSRYCPECGGGRGRARSSYAPHRGGAVLTLAIVSLFCFGFILGPIAWIMARADLKAIDEGSMDPEGRGTTQAGHIISIISTVLNVFMCCGGGLIGFMNSMNQHQRF